MIIQTMPYPAGEATSVEPEMIGTPTFASNNSGSGAINLAYPAGVAPGRIALIHGFVHDSISANDMNVPTGFAEVDQIDIAGFGSTALALFWRRLDGFESGSVSISCTSGHSGTDCVHAHMSIWDGCVATGDPFEQLTTQTGAGNNSMQAGAIDTQGPDRIILDFASCLSQKAASPASGYTEVYERQDSSGTGEGSSFLYKQHLDLPSEVPAAIHTLASSATGWATIRIALRPVPVMPSFSVDPLISSPSEPFANGDTLIGDAGTHDAVEESYQWLRDGSPISGATSLNYLVTEDDIGSLLRLRVTATNELGNRSAYSDETSTIVQADRWDSALISWDEE